MYMLIKERIASKYELDNCFDLDEALKLWALYKMDQDIQLAEQMEHKRDLEAKRR